MTPSPLCPFDLPKALRVLAAVTILVALPLIAAAAGPSAVSVGGLLCEMRENPVGIDTPAPRLSWVLTSAARNQRQTAWQVLAATTTSLLLPGKADLWDSGRRDSDQSILVEYQGQPLRTNERIAWSVRTWDAGGQPSEWSAPAFWTMGPMSPADWQADWISVAQEAAPQPQPIEIAKWIWYPEEVTSGTSPATAPPGITRSFRRTFALPAASVKAATLWVAADNKCTVHLNGSPVGSHDAWQAPKSFSVTEMMRAGGDNRLDVSARNGGNKPGPAGLIAAICVSMTDGTSITVVTDESWESSAGAHRTGGNLADSPSPGELPTWGPARVIGPWGTSPWHRSGFAEGHSPLPMLRKEFAAARAIRRAVVHVCGLGQYKLFLNGQPVGDHFLDPAWSQYDRTSYYNSFDVTRLIAHGPNALGVMLGKGPYNTRGDRRIHGNQNNFPLKLILQAHIEYDDGTSETVKTDTSWRWAPGPLTHDSILGGCDYDARAWPEGWARPDFRDATWSNAARVPAPSGVLSAAFSPPMRTLEEFPPVVIEEPSPGHYVYDFGQNASATPRLFVKGPAGATIRLTYAEQRAGSTPSHNDGHGHVDQSGMHSPNYIEYTLRGDSAPEEWTPPFFYTGYQYLELTGGVPRGFPNPDGLPVVTSLSSIHVRADPEPVGRFSCSDREIDRIDRMVDWSVRSNLGHVLTDCPHREKLGWLEVPYLMWPSIAFRYDLSNFGPKICRDIREAQLTDGQIPTVAPSYPRFQGGFHYTPEWGAAGVFVPWDVYQWYGDRRTLEASYPSMKRFVDYMRDTSDQLVPKPGLGDWYDYGHGQPLGPSRFTPTDLSAMAVFAGCAQTVSRAAAVLGKTDDSAAYADLAKRIAAEFNRRFYAGNGEYRNSGSPQTANAMALVFGLVDGAAVKPVVDRIIADLQTREWQQTSGDVGYRFLLRALADHGRSDAIFAMLRRDQLGSYRFLRNAGWTSLPESWNAYRSYSMNHCMLGHIQEWFVHDLAGIQPLDDAPAFRKFRIHPVVDGDITSASASFRSPHGDIVSRWERAGGKLSLHVRVPVNTTARICIPASSPDAVLEGGRAASQSEGVKLDGMSSGRAVFVAGSGTYQFEAQIRSE